LLYRSYLSWLNGTYVCVGTAFCTPAVDYNTHARNCVSWTFTTSTLVVSGKRYIFTGKKFFFPCYCPALSSWKNEKTLSLIAWKFIEKLEIITCICMCVCWRQSQETTVNGNCLLIFIFFIVSVSAMISSIPTEVKFEQFFFLRISSWCATMLMCANITAFRKSQILPFHEVRNRSILK
jgi:hypothetical protein